MARLRASGLNRSQGREPTLAKMARGPLFDDSVSNLAVWAGLILTSHGGYVETNGVPGSPWFPKMVNSRKNKQRGKAPSAEHPSRMGFFVENWGLPCMKPRTPMVGAVAGLTGDLR